MINKSFLKSSFIMTIGGALSPLASIILLPFYTNLLSDVQYLRVSFYIGVSLFFQILFSFSIESFFGIKYTQLYEEPAKQKVFIGTVSTMLLLIGLGLLLVFAAFGDLLFKHIYRTDLHIDFWPYGFFSILSAFFNSYFKTATVALIYFKMPRLFFILNIGNFIATVFISVGGLYLFPGTIVGPIYGRLISGIAIFLMAHFIFMRYGTFTFDKSLFREIRKFCEPYIFYAICGWVLAQFDRYLLQAYISTTDLNAYDLLLKCFFGIEFVQNSLSAVFYPRVYEIWNKTKVNATTTETNRYFNVFTAVNIIQLILFCIFIPMVYHFLITKPNFYKAETYIGLLAGGYAIRGIFNFYLITILFTKRIDVLLKVFGITTAFQILSTVLAIRYFGLMGAIYAGLATKVLQIALCAVFTRPIFNYQFNYFKIIGIPFLFFGINLLQYFIFKEYSLLLYGIQLLIFSLILFMVFKNEIRKVLISFNVLPES